MLEINKSEQADNLSAVSKQDPTAPSLEELIAKIDSETGKSDAVRHGEGEKNQSPAEKSEFGQKQFIRFSLEDILVAIPLDSALEIGHRPDITPLPNLPDWILGVCNIRGELISVVELKSFFGLPLYKSKRGQRYIVIHNEDIKVGIIVDRIKGILSLDQIDSDVQESPYREGDISSYISGVVVAEDKLLNVLDTDKLLSCPRITSFRIE